MTDDKIIRAAAEALLRQEYPQGGELFTWQAYTGDARALLAAVEPMIREQALSPFESLFAGGPDTDCRTTWPEGIECVEVPADALRRAFDTARGKPMRRYCKQCGRYRGTDAETCPVCGSDWYRDEPAEAEP